MDGFQVAGNIERWCGEDPVGDEVAELFAEEAGPERREVHMLGEGDRRKTHRDRPGAGRVHRAEIGVPRPLAVDMAVRM